MARFLICICLFSLSLVHAKDHGTYGTTFPVLEEDLIEFLKGKLAALSQDEIGSFQEKIRGHYTQHLSEPRPVQGLKEANEYTVHYFDPTVVAKADIQDHEGNTIVRKGDSFNPLERVTLSNNLLFFDGDNPAHISWASSYKGKWVWVRGKPLKWEEDHNRPVYFDQQGFLCKKLKIKTIPTCVSQEGHQLKIESLPVKGEA